MINFALKKKIIIRPIYVMIRSSYINCKIELIELIENFPCNNADELICKKT
jgi:hypothetical protein